MSCTQIGQRALVEGVGAGTVRIGRPEDAEIGGLGLRGGRGLGLEMGVGDGGEGACGEGLVVGGGGLGEEGAGARATVLRMIGLGAGFVEGGLEVVGGLGAMVVGGRPDIRGGGRSRPSVAFLESWREISDA